MPPAPSPLKAVLFDLDNTLTHRLLSIRCYSSVFIDHFGPLLHPISAAETSELLAQADHGGYLPEDSPYASIRESVEKTLAHALPWKSRPSTEVLGAHWKQYFPKSTVPMPGAEAAVRELKRLGFVIAVISNGAHGTRTETVGALPFASSIHAVISSEYAGVKKPSPSIFHRAAHDLGLVAGECIYVGDHPENDYWGAKNAGLHAVWLSGFHAWPVKLARADRAISALPELPGLILEI